jgi:hypothetical protein
LVEGKFVIISDHGNYVDERASPVPIREYGHPRGEYDDVLIQVPWLVGEKEERRRIRTDEGASATESKGQEVITERLRDLGY